MTALSDKQIDLLNKALEYAVDYGGDLGGAYFTARELPWLLEAVNQFLDSFDGVYNVSTTDDHYVHVMRMV